MSRELPDNPIQAIADAAGGTIKEVGILPDNSGFATVSIPLPKHHWIYQPPSFNVPPMPFRLGTNEVFFFGIAKKLPPEGGSITGELESIDKEGFERAIRAAGKYAIRCATMNGSESDYDPDALLQNLVVGMLGYWTANGLTNDEWANPAAPFEFEPEAP